MTSPAPRRSLLAVAEQEGIAALIVELIARAFEALNPADLKGTLPAFRDDVRAVIETYGAASAAAALEAYEDERDAALGRRGRPFDGQVADVAPADVLDAAVNAAISNLWDVGQDGRVDRPPNPRESYGDDLATVTDIALRNVQGVAVRRALDAGRQTVVDNVQRDRGAQGWTREPEADACSFCIMLAIRGPVFKDGSVFDTSNATKIDHSETPSDFKVHDHCRCQLVPVFVSVSQYRLPPDLAAWRDLYRTSTKNETDKANAFRRAVDAQRRDTALPHAA